jgi:hypothetical protein
MSNMYILTSVAANCFLVTFQLQNFNFHQLQNYLNEFRWHFANRIVFNVTFCFQGNIVPSFKFILKVGVEESIVNALYGLRIMDQPFKSYVF